ncbi:MAG: efflux RND transporter periplasmic adaptor subunit [Thermodesulfobacteriota bacterium]|nr:efflux RND transporter periplasmic adaptor subunit [Thermodesulfobacteriota bacterium]
MDQKFITSVMVSVYLLFFVVLCGCRDGNTDILNNLESKLNDEASVKVERVMIGDIADLIITTGTIFPEKESKVGPKLSGRVEKVYVEEGDTIREGEILVKIEQTEFLIAEKEAKASLKIANAQLKSDKLNYENLLKDRERLLNLYQEGIVPQQQFDQIDTKSSMGKVMIDLRKAQVLRAEQNLAMARQRLQDSTIVSPLSGLVVGKFVNEGEFITTMPPNPLVWIMNIDKVKIEVYIPEVHLPEVRIGDSVEIKVDAYPTELFHGKISTINPMIDPMNRTFKVKILISNKDYRLKSGMFARVKILPNIQQNAIVVPIRAVTEREKSQVAFVVENKRATMKVVQTGINDNTYIQILEGLQEGEIVIVEGHYGIEDGANVKIIGE